MDEQNTQNSMQPKPGDVVKPDHKSVPEEPVPAAASQAPVVETPMPAEPAAEPVVAAPTPTPSVEPTASTTPETVPTPPIPVSSAPANHNALFAIILLVVLAAVGGLVYWMYFRQPLAPIVAPVEIRETTESTIPDRSQNQEDTTSLQYLEMQFGGLDTSTTELTNDTEIQNQLGIGSGSSNNSEL